MDGNKFLLDRIAEAVQATGQSNEYCRGMCNGMLFVKFLIDGAEPKYFERADAGERGENSPPRPYIDELRKAAEPLNELLLRRYDPHTCVVVTQRGADLKRDEFGVAFAKGADERGEAFKREIRDMMGGGKAREEADAEKDAEKLRKRLANLRITVEPSGAGGDVMDELAKANARIAELEEKLRDRETALSMRREESEKRLYEIRPVR